jgi:hypothetical protein
MKLGIGIIIGLLTAVLAVGTYQVSAQYNIGTRADTVAKDAEAASGKAEKTAADAEKLVLTALGELKEQQRSRTYIEKSMDRIDARLTKLDKIAEDVARLKGLHEKSSGKEPRE